ncbi:MAG: methyl-accepting chemotaxis protein [Proteobacteria bacterium]|nr:methyl-accepting chemotaxis protein [Pseudomonadota bacterium]
MIKNSLKTKSITGYALILILLLIVGGISIYETGELGKKVNYLSKDVAENVKLADDIKSGISAMRLSCEKYLNTLKENELEAAETEIVSVLSLFKTAEKRTANLKTLETIRAMNILSVKYIAQFRNVVIRHTARSATRKTLYDIGDRVTASLDTHIQNKSEETASADLGDILKHFLKVRILVERFLATLDHQYSEATSEVLENILDSLAPGDRQDIEKIKYDVEEYLDTFEGLVAVSLKMEEDIKEDLFPIAPQIINLARNITTEGWDEMEQARQDVEKKIITTRTKIIGMIACAVILGILASFLSAASIIKPISSVIKGIMTLTDGDLSTRLRISSKDEVGDLAGSVNQFIEKLQGIFLNLSNNAKTLNQSSENMSHLSSTMAESVEAVSEKTNSVSKAAETMSRTVHTIASAMEQTAQNVNMVSEATRQITDIFYEIAQKTVNANTISNNAVDQTFKTSKMVEELGEYASEINEVTEVISNISGQTNLLALNATIEASRAGESGKGFAVVANEIKELARQTAQATLNIKKKIEDIQSYTSTAVTEIQTTSTVINDVSHIVEMISKAVDEQLLKTREIAENASQASKGVSEISDHLLQSSTAADDIANDISAVNASADIMLESSFKVKQSAEDQSKLAKKLNELIAIFKT